MTRHQTFVGASFVMALAAASIAGAFFATDQPPGLVVVAVTIDPLPTNTPRATATIRPTDAPTITPIPSQTPVPCGPEAPAGATCTEPELPWTPIPTLTPIPTYPGEGLATPGTRYVMPEAATSEDQR